MNPIPLLDLKRPLPDLEEPLSAAFTRVLRSGHYILGPEVDAFEAACARYCGAEHAVGVSSGTDALLLALMALDVQPNDEVICPSYTFFATAGSVWRLGAKPVFVDSCPGCFNALPDQVVQRMGPRTKAIMPVHLFGQVSHMDRVLAAAKGRSIPVIEDAAQALGAEANGQRAGSMGTVGCFSFFPSKNLGAFGDAGLVTTSDAALAEKLRILRVHGGKPKYYHAMVGGNFRIDALQAALLAVKLPHLDTYSERRQANAAVYTRLFTESGLAEPTPCICDGKAAAPATHPIGLPAIYQSRHIFNQYVIRLQGPASRDHVRAHLTKLGIGNEVYYPVPLHQQACFAALGHKTGSFPHAEKSAAQSLALPIFPELRQDEIERVVHAVLEACKNA